MIYKTKDKATDSFIDSCNLEKKTCNIESKEINNINILVAEDNRINQILINELITINGWNCTIAEHGGQVIEILKHRKFDLILMDISMPVMDGIEATKLIKKNEEWSKIPVIALTACDLIDNKEEFCDIGMNDYLPKPIKDEELYYMVAKHLHLLEFDDNEKMNCEYIEGFRRLERMLDGNKGMVAKLGGKIVQLFSENKLEEIFMFTQSGDFKRLRDILHMLKGAVLNFQLTTIKDLLQNLYFFAIKNDKQQIVITINEIRIKAKEFEEFLKIYKNKLVILHKMKKNVTCN